MRTKTIHAGPPCARRRRSAAGLAAPPAALLLLLLLLAPAAAAQTQLTEDAAKLLRAQAAEMTRAFMAGDYERLADFTYPKVVEAMGGREKMAEFVRKEMAEVKTNGFETLSYTPAAEPTQVLREGRETYAILPAVMRMGTPSGVMVGESFVIAVSADDGKNWRFISGSLEADKLKLLLPAAADKLKLPGVRYYPEDEKKP